MGEKAKRGVLFVCTGNSCRSQIAEGLARSLAPPGTEIWSAGVAPAGVHPIAMRVMGEIGIDISEQWSKHLDEVPLERMGTVITLCDHANALCPTFSAEVERLHWPTHDPVGTPGLEEEVLRAYRECRDGLRRRLEEFFRGPA